MAAAHDSDNCRDEDNRCSGPARPFGPVRSIRPTRRQIAWIATAAAVIALLAELGRAGISWHLDIGNDVGPSTSNSAPASSGTRGP